MVKATHGPPDFARDPRGWFSSVGSQVRTERWPELLTSVHLAEWVGDHGNAWRLVRSTHGLEIRPSLISPFLRFTRSPRVTAIALGKTIEVELTCRELRWIDRFTLGAFDVAALGHTMLAESELPHDNLPRLFPVEPAEPPQGGALRHDFVALGPRPR